MKLILLHSRGNYKLEESFGKPLCYHVSESVTSIWAILLSEIYDEKKHKVW